MPSDSDSTNKMMDFQSSCDTDGVGSLKGFTNPNFSGSHGSDNGTSHAGHVRKFSSKNSSQSSIRKGEIIV